jgi:hypothetical protein
MKRRERLWLSDEIRRLLLEEMAPATATDVHSGLRAMREDAYYSTAQQEDLGRMMMSCS